ncbi:MAG: putative DNA binding domain-containing protein [Bacteroidaceae bacterium]|nr:putative DNA binding domain-containing protein [Bacteroidaceae bacterium]
MNEEIFIKLAKAGESTQIEYKTCTEKISESLYETICSFLNHSGGRILLGVKDNGKIIGVNPDKVEILKTNIVTAIKNQDLFLPCPYFTPHILDVERKKVLLLDIPCGQYVYRYNGRYWDRNGEADIDVTDQPELLLTLFERKNPHLFEERVVEGLKIEHLEQSTFQFCRNIVAVIKPNHSWLQLTDDEILIHTHLARKDYVTGELKLKYAALILFGKEEAIEEFMPRYRFEALFHMCTYEQYNDMTQFPNRYNDRKTMRCNLIKVYDRLTQFAERYLPDKFYLPAGSTQREDLRWNLFREVIGNLCVHTDYSTGYACFFHVFKDRVVTKNPTRLLPETPEGELTLKQLNNYTKNPLLVRVFHELSWVEDMGSGIRNILRYAPLYYPDYKVEISNGSQFTFSITYAKMSVEISEIVSRNPEMSEETSEDVSRNSEMSVEISENVIGNPDVFHEFDDWKIPLEEMSRSKKMVRGTKQNVPVMKHKQRRQIICSTMSYDKNGRQ